MIILSYTVITFVIINIHVIIISPYKPSVLFVRHTQTVKTQIRRRGAEGGGASDKCLHCLHYIIFY